MTRDERQTLTKKKFKDSKGRAVICCSTGYGKTKVGLDLALELFQSNYKAIIHVVVPSQILKDQWKKLATKRHINLEVYIINTYCKQQQECDFLIIDEIHRSVNEDSLYFSQTIDNTKFKYFLGLTATLEPKHIEFLANRNIPLVDIITKEEARENGWIANYSEYILKLKLNEEDSLTLKNLNKSISSSFGFFGRDAFDSIRRSLGDKSFREQLGREKGISEAQVFLRARNTMNYIRLRKDMLHNSLTKEEAIKEIVEKIPSKTLVFGQSIIFADKIADLINTIYPDQAASVHSKIGKKKNTETLRKLKDNRYKLDYVTSAKQLQEGLDIPDLELGIIASYTSKAIAYVQCLGRIARFMKNKTKAIIITLCIEDSQEEVWLDKMECKGKIVYSVDEILQLEGLIENNIEIG